MTDGLNRRGETFIRDLTADTSETLSYRSGFKEDLLRIIEELEEVAATAGALDPYLAPEDASVAASVIQSVIEVWACINEAIDHAVSRVVRGQADKSFQLLSPIANAENLRGRRRLVRLHEGLEELASRARPTPPEPDIAETTEPVPAEDGSEIQASVEEEDGSSTTPVFSTTAKRRWSSRLPSRSAWNGSTAHTSWIATTH